MHKLFAKILYVEVAQRRLLMLLVLGDVSEEFVKFANQVQRVVYT